MSRKEQQESKFFSRIDSDNAAELQDTDTHAGFVAAGSAEEAERLRRNAGFRAPADDEEEETNRKSLSYQGGQGGFIVPPDSPAGKRAAGYKAGDGKGDTPESGLTTPGGDSSGNPASGFNTASVGPGTGSFGFSIPLEWLDSPREYKDPLNRTLDRILAQKLSDPKADNVMLIIHGWRDLIPLIKEESYTSEQILRELNRRKTELMADPGQMKGVMSQAIRLGNGLNMDAGNPGDMNQFHQKLSALKITNKADAAADLRKMEAAGKKGGTPATPAPV